MIFFCCRIVRMPTGTSGNGPAQFPARESLLPDSSLKRLQWRHLLSLTISHWPKATLDATALLRLFHPSGGLRPRASSIPCLRAQILESRTEFRDLERVFEETVSTCGSHTGRAFGIRIQRCCRAFDVQKNDGDLDASIEATRSTRRLLQRNVSGPQQTGS